MYLDWDLCVVVVLYMLNNENLCLHPGYYLSCGTCVWCDKFGDSGHMLCIACIWVFFTCVYFWNIFIENQQMHQNDHFIVMSSQTLLHVSAYQRHHQGHHMIPTSYLYISVHYRKKNGISSKIVPVGIVTLCMQVGMANCCWKQWAVVEHMLMEWMKGLWFKSKHVVTLFFISCQ
jgi:hypothetical protein